MNTTQPRIPVQESLLFMVILTAVGGYMNAYSFLTHGAFTSLHTGNMVNLGMNLFQGRWSAISGVLFPIIGNITGAFLAELLKRTQSGCTKRTWQRSTIAIELVVLGVIALLPQAIPDALANWFLSVTAGFQLSNFRSDGGQGPLYHQIAYDKGVRPGIHLLQNAAEHQGDAEADQDTCQTSLGHGFCHILSPLKEGPCRSPIPGRYGFARPRSAAESGRTNTPQLHSSLPSWNAVGGIYLFFFIARFSPPVKDGGPARFGRRLLVSPPAQEGAPPAFQYAILSGKWGAVRLFRLSGCRRLRLGVTQHPEHDRQSGAAHPGGVIRQAQGKHGAQARPDGEGDDHQHIAQELDHILALPRQHRGAEELADGAQIARADGGVVGSPLAGAEVAQLEARRH